MLISFSVENFKSFKEKQILDLTTTSAKEHPENVFYTDKKIGIAKSAVIFGANASGKSNLLEALYHMRKIIVEGVSASNSIPTIPFKLDKSYLEKPTTFEVELFIDDKIYTYGFITTKDRIMEEWLFAMPHNRQQTWFTRKWDEQTKEYSWKIGSFLSGQKKIWIESTRNNALFLSTAVNLNSKDLEPIFNWFAKKLHHIDPDGINPGFTFKQCEEETELKNEIINFMKVADFNISNIEIKKKKVDINLDLPFIPLELREKIIKDSPNAIRISSTLYHQNSHGELIEFDFNEESAGTQKFLAYAGPVLDVLEKGYTLVVDELNCNLHPKLVEFLIKLFNNPKKNKNNAQLIFSTHETSVLSQEIFRRDQIWFCKRDIDQSTQLYSLSDFGVKKDKTNIELGYLAGKYEAIPFISDWD